jgi:hypothetical protein
LGKTIASAPMELIRIGGDKIPRIYGESPIITDCSNVMNNNTLTVSIQVEILGQFGNGCFLSNQDTITIPRNVFDDATRTSFIVRAKAVTSTYETNKSDSDEILNEGVGKIGVELGRTGEATVEIIKMIASIKGSLSGEWKHSERHIKQEGEKVTVTYYTGALEITYQPS